MDGPRLIFLGTSGSGKTTTARLAAARLALPHIELDAIRHGPNWKETPDDEFCRIVAEHAAKPAWVIDGNYLLARNITMPRATQIVWVNPPLQVVMGQVIKRSLHRAITRKELWNGNREQWRFLLRRDHPIRWAWSTYHRRRRDFEKAMTDKWICLRSRGEIRRWLNTLPACGARISQSAVAPQTSHGL